MSKIVQGGGHICRYAYLHISSGAHSLNPYLPSLDLASIEASEHSRGQGHLSMASVKLCLSSVRLWPLFKL